MWTTKQLKQGAKKILSKNYWKAFLVTLVLLTVTGASSGFSGGASGFSNGFKAIANKKSNNDVPKFSLYTDNKDTETNSFSGDSISIKIEKGNIYVNDKQISSASGDFKFDINGKKIEFSDKDGSLTVDGKKIKLEDIAGNIEVNKDSVVVKDGSGKVVFNSDFKKGKEIVGGALAIFFIIFALIMVVVSIFVCLIEIFVINPVVVGGKNYFNRQREGTGKFTNIFGGFAKGHYKASVRNMFLMGLYEFLWSLLFVIPGIIKGYSYWMVPYITAANPNLSASRAFEISKKTMSGEKWHTFVLGLTFLGWDILAAITLVGGYFLAPYKETTYAELYATLKQKAIANGYATEEELAIAA